MAKFKTKLAGPNHRVYKTGLQMYIPVARPQTDTISNGTPDDAIRSESATDHKDSASHLAECDLAPDDQVETSKTGGNNDPKQTR